MFTTGNLICLGVGALFGAIATTIVLLSIFLPTLRHYGRMLRAAKGARFFRP